MRDIHALLPFQNILRDARNCPKSRIHSGTEPLPRHIQGVTRHILAQAEPH